MATVDISSLTRLAQNYQRDLRYLPYFAILEELARHKITLYPGVQDKDTIVTFLRKQGITKPYDPTSTLGDKNLGKMIERDLNVDTAYARIVDNIKNYKEKIIVRPGEMIGANKTHSHPFQLIQMMQQIRTFGEDILDALFNAERDLTDESPLGLFDGFETLVLAAITSGEVAVAEGNMINSGVLTAPSDATDFTAYENLRDWLRQADSKLKRNCILYMTQAVYQNVWDAMQNKRSQKANDFTELVSYLKQDAALGKFDIVVSEHMGTGYRLYLTAPNNMDFGMNSIGDETFAKILPYDGDPNKFYIWMQGDYGTRWQQFHKKAFLTNTGTLTANQLSGDYVS